MNPKVDDEARVVAALRNVARDGNAAAAADNSPGAALMRIRVEEEGLARWDPYAGRVVLTLSGRQRLADASRGPGVVLAFPRRAPAARR